MATKEIKLKTPKKLKKSSLILSMLGAPKAVYQKYKKAKQKSKTDNEAFVKQQKDEASKLTTQATKNFDDLNDAQKKVWNTLDGKGWSTAKKIKYILGGGTALTVGGGAIKFGLDVNKKMGEMNKGGYVKMNRGGEAKSNSSSYKKSRGVGAAIKGTKFKGVF